MTNMFLDKDLGYLLPKYIGMSKEEVVESSYKLKKEQEILSIKYYIKSIIIFLGDNNRYLSSFTRFDLNKIDDFIVVKKQNEITDYVSISKILFNFNIDNILDVCYESICNQMFLTAKKDYLSAEDFKRIYTKLIYYKPTIKPIVKTYLMTDASGLYKIGKSNNIKNRFICFKTGNPSIKLIAICDENIENILHKKYILKKIIGEWFELTKNDILHLIKDYKFIKHIDNENQQF